MLGVMASFYCGELQSRACPAGKISLQSPDISLSNYSDVVFGSATTGSNTPSVACVALFGRPVQTLLADLSE